jgi:hypothetical protein
MLNLNLKDVGGLLPEDPLYKEFEIMLATYEAMITEKNGQNTRATRTWEKLGRVGIIKCLEDWSLKPQPTEGFAKLVESGQVDLTAEAIVVRYAGRFSPEAVRAAQLRLDSIQ